MSCEQHPGPVVLRFANRCLLAQPWMLFVSGGTTAASVVVGTSAQP